MSDPIEPCRLTWQLAFDVGAGSEFSQVDIRTGVERISTSYCKEQVLRDFRFGRVDGECDRPEPDHRVSVRMRKLDLSGFCQLVSFCDEIVDEVPVIVDLELSSL